MTSSPQNSSKPEPSLHDGNALIEAQRRRDLAEHHERLARDRMERRSRELEARIGASLIPQRYREYTFDTFPDELIIDPEARERARLARQRCERYAENWDRIEKRGTNLLLIGPMGSGKTGLACSIGNYLIRNHQRTVLFMTAYAAIRHQRDTWKRRDKTETDALRDLVDVDLLILDDVGAHRGNEGELLMLFEALNGRYAARKPTILLSNLPAHAQELENGTKQEGLDTFLGGRIWDRLTDDQSVVIACDWQSLRGKGGSA
jgi:DNA replication protein DnaC